MQHEPFQMQSHFEPQGDQPAAIESLLGSFSAGALEQTLLGVTGSGKTFTIANTINKLNMPTLVIAHNKTLAAQLHGEFKELFPKNAVEYFVSYYDYYQPEAYVPSTDTYIDKDSHINDAIDRMRHSATRALFERSDVIIVSSVSCIYGLGSAEAYYDMLAFLQVGDVVDRDSVLRKLTSIQYVRNDIDFHRGTFRVRGDVLEIFPPHEQDRAVRVEWFGDEIESIVYIDPLRGQVLGSLPKIAIYPSTHHVITPEAQSSALDSIRVELQARLQVLRDENKLLEAQRLEQRTVFDLEMLEQMGYCNGVENYSRHFTRRAPGVPPPTLVDYFPSDYLVVIDESHQTVPQIGAMYRGDRSRKQTLVDHGFRLPSALDNRPLRFEEFKSLTNRVIYASATPGDYEFEQTHGVIVEQVVRPTGLLDPQIEVRPVDTQVDDLLEQIRIRVKQNQRILVTTLTKRMAEDLTEFYTEAGIKVRYLHSDIDTLERIDILHDLRLGIFDVLVGINLLREGLDLPEVSLVAVLDADKEGFLRSERALVQTAGRAARHAEGLVLFYAARITDSMRRAMDETERRRAIQEAHNTLHGIVPRTIEKAITRSSLGQEVGTDAADVSADEASARNMPPDQMLRHIESLRGEMQAHAQALEFEKAANLRDHIKMLEALHLRVG